MPICIQANAFTFTCKTKLALFSARIYMSGMGRLWSVPVFKQAVSVYLQTGRLWLAVCMQASNATHGCMSLCKQAFAVYEQTLFICWQAVPVYIQAVPVSVCTHALFLTRYPGNRCLYINRHTLIHNHAFLFILRHSFNKGTNIPRYWF